MKQQSYFRTLVFTVFVVLATIAMILCLVLVPFTRTFLPFIVTVEIGLFLIIIYCIVSVIRKEKQFDAMSNPSNYVVKFDTCPDYFNRKYDESSRKFYCSNDYVVQHPLDSSRRAIMKLMLFDPLQQSLQFPSNHSNEYINKQNGSQVKPLPTEKFYLDVFQDKSLKGTIEKCALVDDTALTTIPDDTVEFRADYKKLPWTSVTSRCNGLYAKYM
jgi:hypothetical protein